MTTEALLPSEANYYDEEGSVSTITIFKGPVPLTAIQNRVREILNANPWLAARLGRDSDDTVKFVLPTATPSISPFFQSHLIGDISNASNVDGLIKEINSAPVSRNCANLFAQKGARCIDNDEPLFKLRLCLGDDGRFALIFSMSHVIGDGTTYYNVYRMFDLASPVVALNFQRKTQYLARTARGTLLDPSQRQVMLKRVNRDKLDAQKQEINAAIAPNWVSTHDVLTSWFFTATQSKSGVIAVNARPHRDYLSSNDVGNYVALAVCDTQGGVSAMDIRSAVEQFRASPEESENAPPISTEAFITSWAQNYTDLNFGEECMLESHFPCQPLMPQFSGSVSSLYKNFLLVFCLNSRELGVVVLSDDLDKFLREDSLLA